MCMDKISDYLQLKTHKIIIRILLTVETVLLLSILSIIIYNCAKNGSESLHALKALHHPGAILVGLGMDFLRRIEDDVRNLGVETKRLSI